MDGAKVGATDMVGAVVVAVPLALGLSDLLLAFLVLPSFGAGSPSTKLRDGIRRTTGYLAVF